MKTKMTIAAAALVGGLETAMKQLLQRYVLMVLGSLLMAHALSAQVTYQYTGNNFTTFTKDGAYTATNHVTVTLVLNAALPKNQNLHSIPSGQFVSMTLNDGAQTITQTSASPDGKLVGSIFLSIDKNGNISAWDICESVPAGPLVQTTNVGGAQYDVGANHRGTKTWIEGYNRKQPGNWVMH